MASLENFGFYVQTYDSATKNNTLFSYEIFIEKKDNGATLV